MISNLLHIIFTLKHYMGSRVAYVVE